MEMFTKDETYLPGTEKTNTRYHLCKLENPIFELSSAFEHFDLKGDEFNISTILKKRIYMFILAESKLSLNDAAVIAAYCVDYGEKYNVHPYLIVSIIKTESNFVNKIINHKNCFGLAQVRPFDNGKNDVWLEELKQKGIIKRAKDLLSEGENIAACAYILSKYRKIYPSPTETLSRYSGKEINLPYCERVLENLSKFERFNNA